MSLKYNATEKFGHYSTTKNGVKNYRKSEFVKNQFSPQLTSVKQSQYSRERVMKKSSMSSNESQSLLE